MTEFRTPLGVAKPVGRGCGCARCRAPLPYVAPQDPAEAAARRAAYAAGARTARQLAGCDFPKGRGRERVA